MLAVSMSTPYREAAFHEIVHEHVEVLCPWCKSAVRVEVAVDAECIVCGARFSVALAKRVGAREPAVMLPPKRSVVPRVVAAIAAIAGIAVLRPVMMIALFVAYGVSISAMAVWHVEHDRAARADPDR
jgi:hypothetical protein